MRNGGAVILAAGGSTRLGQPKQLLLLQGESLVRRVVRAAAEGGCTRVAVVAGSDSERIGAELAETSAQLVANPNWQRGIGSSIRAGVKHLIDSKDQPEAILLLSCDQPFVDARLISALIATWEISGKAMVASRYANTLGVPALFDRSCFEALLALPDDSGAKGLLESCASEVGEVEFEAGAFDIDTAADYERAISRFKEES